MKRCFQCMEEYEEGQEKCPVCGFFDQQEDGVWLEPGTILQGRYIVGTFLYYMESDLLYIGWDALFSRKVLIQEFFPQFCSMRAGQGKLKVYDSKTEPFEAGKNIFIGVGLKLISLDDTPNLLNVFSVFEENHTAYITMEYPGKTALWRDLERWGCFDEEDMLSLMEALSIPLKAAHEHQVFHGRISLDCCFISESGEYKLGCFQSARYVCTEQRADGERLENPESRSDVYGLANLAGQVLFGEEVWNDSDIEERYELLEGLCSQAAADTLKRALSISPPDRPESVEVFCHQLSGKEKGVFANTKKKSQRWKFWLSAW